MNLAKYAVTELKYLRPLNESRWAIASRSNDYVVDDDGMYIVGVVADRLHEYEALGYEPEELAKKLERLEELEKAQKGFREEFKLDLKTSDIHQLTGNTHRFNRDEMAAIEAALKRDDKAVTFTRTDDEVMVTIAPWSKEEE